MSSSLIDSLKYSSQQIITYVGITVLIAGLLGNTLNIIIFLSLKTFRETSCAFYLTIASFVNIFQLVTGLLARILSSTYNIDATRYSIILCKTRIPILTAAALISLTSMCFAAADQYASVTIRWNYLSNKRIAYWFIGISCIIWSLHSIPIIFYSNIYQTNFSVQTKCGLSNTIYVIYYSRVFVPVLVGFLPVLIRTIFGLLAFINVRSLSRRTIPVIRSRRDRQLTSMVLIEVVFDNIFTLLYIIYYLYSSNTIPLNSLDTARDELLSSLTTVLYYLTFAASFYIYFAVSGRFRQQLIYVLSNHHLKNCYGNHNQIAPQSNQNNPITVNIDDNEKL